MKNKQYEIRTEEKEFNCIKSIYEAMIKSDNNINLRRNLVNEVLSKQKEDGSWATIETRMCDSDIRVHYVYFPTYYATAALMFADLEGDFAADSPERNALLKGLEIASERKLMGHGVTATRQMLDALKIYKGAGVYHWINKKANANHGFAHLICERIAQMRADVNSGNTISDWSEDFKEEYELELQDYDKNESPFVWYACYGSNINKERFMQYIHNCKDQTPPVEDRPFKFKHNIYFAKNSGRWYNGGKAFLDDTAPGKAYGRIYKIRKSQFEEIKIAEGRDYSKLLELGEIQEIPVYSFTDVERSSTENVPSDKYYKTIFEGLKECYEGFYESYELNNYLVNCIFPSNAFIVAKTIKESAHCVTNDDVFAATGLHGEDLNCAVQWLLEHKIIKQDKRSVRAGHHHHDGEAYFYTVDSNCARRLLSVILEIGLV